MTTVLRQVGYESERNAADRKVANSSSVYIQSSLRYGLITRVLGSGTEGESLRRVD